jgi:hypothetical protein
MTSRNERNHDLARARAILRQMKNGARSHWTLSNGKPVAPRIAERVTHHCDVRNVDRALFAEVPGQTWKWGLGFLILTSEGGKNLWLR